MQFLLLFKFARISGTQSLAGPNASVFITLSGSGTNRILTCRKPLWLFYRPPEISSEEVCPWQHTVKLQRGNFRVKMPDWVFDSFQPLTDVFNGVHSLPFTQPQQMESAVILLLCLATSLFLFSPSFFPSRLLCFISWLVLRRDHYITLVPSNEVSSEKWAYIMKNWLYSFEIKEFDIDKL